MATKVLAYECKHCGALKRTKKLCERHELSCLHNPEARNCVRCANMVWQGNKRICAEKLIQCNAASSAHCDKFIKKEDIKYEAWNRGSSV